MLLGLLGAWYFSAARHRAGELADLVAELDATDPGWRLEDIEKNRAEIPEGENSARVCVRVAMLVPGSWPAEDFHRLLAAGEPPRLWDVRQLERVQKELDGKP